jgi:dynein heavy chain
VSPEELDNLESMIEQIFFFALIWSVGATVDEEGREKYNQFLRSTMENKKSRVEFPKEGQVYDYQWVEKNKAFEAWTERFKDFEVD